MLCLAGYIFYRTAAGFKNSHEEFDPVPLEELQRCAVREHIIARRCARPPQMPQRAQIITDTYKDRKPIFLRQYPGFAVKYNLLHLRTMIGSEFTEK
jgi:hypothetical protein